MGPPYTQHCRFYGLISRQFTLQSLAYHTENGPKWKFSSIFFHRKRAALEAHMVLAHHGAIFMVESTPKIIFQALLSGDTRAMF